MRSRVQHVIDIDTPSVVSHTRIRIRHTMCSILSLNFFSPPAHIIDTRLAFGHDARHDYLENLSYSWIVAQPQFFMLKNANNIIMVYD